MQHCIVNLYRSVSKREKMPSGRVAGSAAIELRRDQSLRVNCSVRSRLPIAVNGGVVGQARVSM